MEVPELKSFKYSIHLNDRMAEAEIFFDVALIESPSENYLDSEEFDPTCIYDRVIIRDGENEKIYVRSEDPELFKKLMNRIQYDLIIQAITLKKQEREDLENRYHDKLDDFKEKRKKH